MEIELIKRQLANWYSVGGIIALGGMLYLLYRPESLLMFNLFDGLGLMPFVEHCRMIAHSIVLPDFVIYSLPAGLWTASYLLAMYLTTKYQSKKIRLMLALPLPISAILLEFMQLFGWCPGTFDIYDLICYIVPLIVFVKSI